MNVGSFHQAAESFRSRKTLRDEEIYNGSMAKRSRTLNYPNGPFVRDSLAAHLAYNKISKVLPPATNWMRSKTSSDVYPSYPSLTPRRVSVVHEDQQQFHEGSMSLYVRTPPRGYTRCAFESPKQFERIRSDADDDYYIDRSSSKDANNVFLAARRFLQQPVPVMPQAATSCTKKSFPRLIMTSDSPMHLGTSMTPSFEHKWHHVAALPREASDVVDWKSPMQDRREVSPSDWHMQPPQQFGVPIMNSVSWVDEDDFSSSPHGTFLSSTTAECTPKDLPTILALPEDRFKLSPHQVFLRHQIEAFQATEEDISTRIRGRNKRVRLGQVGIRCRYCAHLPVALRQKGSVYFPATLLGLYQAAQNMSATHLQCGLCTQTPMAIKRQFAALMSTRAFSSGAGRPYWAQSAKKLGLVDTDEGIRFVHDVTKASSPTECQSSPSPTVESDGIDCQ